MSSSKLFPTVRVCMVFGLLAGLGILAGCDGGKTSRLNAPPQGQTMESSPMRENYVAMTDNALLAEGSMSSAHFVPRTSELNANGVRRLTRYASILRTYGGSLRYDGRETDSRLRESRIDQIESFLLACGLEEGTFSVDAGVADGSGMDAFEASDIRAATRAPGKVDVPYGGGETSSLGGGGGSN